MVALVTWRRARDGMYEIPIRIGDAHALLFGYETKEDMKPVYIVGIGSPVSEYELINARHTPENPVMIGARRGKISLAGVSLLIANRDKIAQADNLPESLQQGLIGLLDALQRQEFEPFAP